MNKESNFLAATEAVIWKYYALRLGIKRLAEIDEEGRDFLLNIGYGVTAVLQAHKQRARFNPASGKIYLLPKFSTEDRGKLFTFANQEEDARKALRDLGFIFEAERNYDDSGEASFNWRVVGSRWLPEGYQELSAPDFRTALDCLDKAEDAFHENKKNGAVLPETTVIVDGHYLRAVQITHGSAMLSRYEYMTVENEDEQLHCAICKKQPKRLFRCKDYENNTPHNRCVDCRPHLLGFVKLAKITPGEFITE